MKRQPGGVPATVFGLILLIPAYAFGQSGGTYDLTWNTLDGGGGASAGGTYLVRGTIGQADAGKHTGGTFTVSGGFWFGGSAVTPGGAAPQTAPFPHDRRKNRYISFDPNKPENDGINVAFKVELLSINLGSCDDATGAELDFCRVDRSGEDCNACSTSGSSCITAPVDCGLGESCNSTGATCFNDRPHSGGASVGQIWWIGPDKNTTEDASLNIHLLVTEPFRKVSDNWPNPIHGGDCEVVPGASYGITAVETAGGSESTELVVFTTQFPPVLPPAPFWWGDVVGELKFHCNANIQESLCSSPSDCGGDACERAWELPNGVVNFDDVTVILWTKDNVEIPADKTWADLRGSDSFLPGSQNYDPPNYKINVSDLQEVGAAFGGAPYKFYDPKDCPNEPDWPTAVR